MNAKPYFLRFLTDNNVPDSVGNALMDLGHDVVRLRDVMPADSTDPVVAKAAIEDKRILLSWDRDFFQQRFMGSRYAHLNRLAMSGPEMEGARRIRETIDLISFANQRVSAKSLTMRVSLERIMIHA